MGRITHRLAVALAAGALLGASPALAMDGAEWQRLPAASRSAYVMGIVDTWQSLVSVQEALGVRDTAITVFAGVVGCLRDRLWSYPQIAEIVERYMSGNPGRWSGEMPDLVYGALGEQCRR
jgi:hypothetical protein